MSNKLINDNSMWKRQQYEITKINDVDFIVIKRGAEKEYYDPLTKEILSRRPKSKLDHMESSPHVAFSRVNPESYDEILDFVNTWGLLGLQHTKKYTNRNHLEEIFVTPLFRFDYPEIRDLYQNTRRKKGERDREPVLVFQQAVKDYQQIINGVMKYTNYQLPKEFNSKKQKKEFVNKRLELEEQNLPYDEKDHLKEIAISTEETEALVPFLKLNEMLSEVHPQVFWDVEESSVTNGWRYSSLLAANYLRIREDFREGKSFIHCKWKGCKKLFIPQNPTNKYCHEKCRNSDNVYRLQLKNWLNNVKLHYPNHPENEIEKLFHSLVEDGYSGEKTILKQIKQRLELT